MCVVAGVGVSANVSGNGTLNSSKTIKPLVFTDERDTADDNDHINDNDTNDKTYEVPGDK